MQAPGCILLGCNQFRAVEEADTMRFILENDDEWHGGYRTERMTSGTWLTIRGQLRAARHPSLIEASGALYHSSEFPAIQSSVSRNLAVEEVGPAHW
jgi:hypothetical protein